MNFKCIISLGAVIILTGAPCWGSAWDFKSICQGVTDRTAYVSNYFASAAAPAAHEQRSVDNDLLDAAREGDIETVNKLLGKEEAKKANVNVQNRYGFTPLMKAAMAVNKENGKLIAKILISRHAIIDMVDNQILEKTALMYAAEYGNAGMVDELIKAGADVSKRDRCGKTALWYAKSYASHIKPISEEATKAKEATQKILEESGAVE